jgi:methylated-DNA-[protein]-cysteine S-methyltransferase
MYQDTLVSTTKCNEPKEIIHTTFLCNQRDFVLLSFKNRLCGLILPDFSSKTPPLIKDSPVFDHLKRNLKKITLKKGEIPLFKKTTEALRNYFNKNLFYFNLPLIPIGTPFQKIVWKNIANIPFGKTITYKDLANELNFSTGFRAVAKACQANPLPIIIPCHRVIGKKDLGGYSAGLSWKKFLLALEENLASLYL